LTTLAIVGAGVLGRSFLFHLSQCASADFKIFLFDHSSFATSCSTHSTAVSSLRGTTKGHSPLGDLIVEGFADFKHHVEVDRPAGVAQALQLNASSGEKDSFFKRFSESKMINHFESILFNRSYHAQLEEAFIIHPEIYLSWLLEEAKRKIDITLVSDFVTGFEERDNLVELTTQSGEKTIADKVLFAGGVFNRFWQGKSEFQFLEKSRPIQGSYLHFKNYEGLSESLSITLDGHNLVFRKETKDLLLGASSEELVHELPQTEELKEIYDYFKASTNLSLPPWESGEILVGLREKAPKRSPYLLERNRVLFVGGLYKNGFSLSSLMAKKILSLDFFHKL
jgi:hypothetical protein